MSEKQSELGRFSDRVEFHFVSSAGHQYTVDLEVGSDLQNLMEILRDYGFEDWGACRGRAWCRTCHVSFDQALNLPLGSDENEALEKVYIRTPTSRLACQIDIVRELDGITITYQGDD